MLSFYEVDWHYVVRQCYDALRRRNEWYAARAKMAACTEEPAVHTIYYGDNNPLPQTLLLDRRLTPLERNTWQVLYWLITERNVKTPRYQDLQPYLATPAAIKLREKPSPGRSTFYAAPAGSA